MKKILAEWQGHKITADFKSEEEYSEYCKTVINQCFDIALTSLTLEELTELWKSKNT